MISYDLRQPGQTYDAMDRAITKAGGTRVLESQWLLPSNVGAHTVWQALQPLTDGNDALLVTELTSDMEWSAGKLLISDDAMRGLRRFARL